MIDVRGEGCSFVDSQVSQQEKSWMCRLTKDGKDLGTKVVDGNHETRVMLFSLG